MTQSFVHLHLHTEFSIVDSTVRIPALMPKCAESGMPAVAMTDQGNLFGLVKFYRKALLHGVKPLIGVDLRVRSPDEDVRPFTLVLLCQDQDGYRNLTRLVSRSYLE
ncbi:MAG: PHP domain-containing protein, partial [Gammaproteobacteria bacterium]|nr:PHP domain-containing protein [Gammaproteobacteria bacterium]